MTELLTKDIPTLDIPESMPLPLYVNKHGAVRISGTRVNLDLVIYAFKEGKRPEEIVESYDTLDLADVYA